MLDIKKLFPLDEYFEAAGRFLIESGEISIGAIQYACKIGYNRADRIMKQLSIAGVVGPEEQQKSRTLLMNMEEFESLLNSKELQPLLYKEKAETNYLRKEQYIKLQYYYERIDYLTPDDFVQFCYSLLEAYGFQDVFIIDSSDSFGIDITAEFNGKKQAIACKHSNKNISIAHIQKLPSGQLYHQCDEMLFITNQYFSEDAYEFAMKIGISIWDREDIDKIAHKLEL